MSHSLAARLGALDASIRAWLTTDCDPTGAFIKRRGQRELLESEHAEYVAAYYDSFVATLAARGLAVRS